MTTYRAAPGAPLTLFYKGHDHHPGAVAQISVPAQFGRGLRFESLPKAAVIQPFRDVTDGALRSSPNSLGLMGNGAGVTGLLVRGGKLLVSASLWYEYSQNNSHGVSGVDLSEAGDFEGFMTPTGRSVIFPRAMSGSMVNIPAEWQAALGGDILGGNYPTSIISANSSGPSLTVLRVNTAARPARYEGETVMFFPLDRAMCGVPGCHESLNPIFTWATEYTGKAFIPGTRTVIFVGKHPVGEMWYGGPTSPTGKPASCDDGGWGQKAAGWEYRVAAFDANDLVRVRQGKLDRSAVRPYATWPIPDFPVADCTKIRSAAYDEETQQLFIAHGARADIRIDVYRVGANVVR
jgi:hypothetical protein